MVAPLFGWSAGDVVSAARALYKIGQAFSETQGAASQYAEASKVLEYLAKDRQRAKELIDSRANSKYTPDIRLKLEIVDAAYGAFEQHQHDYKELEPALSATGTKGRDLLRKQSKKIRWAMEQMTGKLMILKDAVAEPLGCMTASYLHFTLDEIAAIREATTQQNVDLHSLELSLGLGSERQRKELVSARATLAHLLTRLDDQQLDLTMQLVALQISLERIEGQTKTITTSQTLVETNSASMADKEYQSTLIQTEIQKNTDKLWDELIRSHETQKGTSETILEITKKLSQLEIALGLFEVRGRRVETSTMISACSTIALLATNILTVLKVRSMENALQENLSGQASYRSNRLTSVALPVVEASEPTIDSRLKTPKSDFGERHAVVADAWTRANIATATAVVNMIEVPLVACDETDPTVAGGNTQDRPVPIRGAYPSRYQDQAVSESQSRISISSSELPTQPNTWAVVQPAEYIELHHPIQASRTGTGDKHWALDVFTDMSETTLKTSKEKAEFHGETMPDAIAWLRKGNMKQLLKIEFGQGIFVYFFIRYTDLRARILCEIPEPAGGHWYSSLPLNKILLERKQSTIELLRIYSPDRATLWLNLPFTSVERLVLFYNTFLSLRSQDRHKTVTPITDHELLGERRVFACKIHDDERLHGLRFYALRVYRDQFSRSIRLQASVLERELENVPVWTAFITNNIRLRYWMRRKGERSICLPFLKCHFFLPSGRWQMRENSEQTLVFITSSDAREFTRTIDELADEYRK